MLKATTPFLGSIFSGEKAGWVTEVSFRHQELLDASSGICKPLFAHPTATCFHKYQVWMKLTEFPHIFPCWIFPSCHPLHDLWNLIIWIWRMFLNFALLVHRQNHHIFKNSRIPYFGPKWTRRLPPSFFINQDGEIRGLFYKRTAKSFKSCQIILNQENTPPKEKKLLFTTIRQSCIPENPKPIL